MGENKRCPDEYGCSETNLWRCLQYMTYFRKGNDFLSLQSWKQ